MYRTIEILTALFILGLILPSQVLADWRDDLPDDLRLNGRYFFAGGYSFDRPYIDESPFGEINFRLNGRYKINPLWRLEFAWQTDGTYLQNIGRIPASDSNGLVNLDWSIDKKLNWRAGHKLDRLNLNYRGDDFTLDIGRQRIAWGTTMTMSFMDMFHSIRPGDPFVPEQPGTDAVRMQIATGMVSGWDILYAWFDDNGAEAFAVKYHDVNGDFESAISAGRLRGENFAAFETSGDINDVGVRIEAALRDTEDGDRYQVAVESDYAPNSHTYLSGEILYNGPGATDPMKYDPDILERGMLFPARWYAGINCMYNPGGLSTLGIFGLMNLTDDSWFADISIQHSLSNSSDLRIGFQHYEGKMLTEYGAMPDMLYVIMTEYF